ncbi:MAG TPA: outer membrane protein assembly factor [Cytophagales bacterium]|jgi:outer membrane protein assembly factor BamA|nr:outer membrane protein assembly factor [Cytophagales bacterium]
MVLRRHIIYFGARSALLLVLGLCTFFSFGQQPSSDLPANVLQGAKTDTMDAYYLIDKVFIVGNKKTKEHIIRRELKIHDGMWLFKPEIDELLEKEREKVVNTRLFIEVDINYLELGGNKIDVIVRVLERWYLFPIPLLELADRNFTEWWTNQNRDLSRLEYGIRLTQYNFRGRNETVNLLAQFGFTKKLALGYRIPYINRNQKLGLRFLFSYATNKNTNYRTESHRLQFADSEETILETFRSNVVLTFRPNFYSRHAFGMQYDQSSVNDTIQELNPNYFLDTDKKQQYLSIYYQFTADKRDFVAYPLDGSLFQASIDQKGLGIFDDVAITTLYASYGKFWDLGKNYYAGNGIRGMASFPSRQPYNLYQGLGYNQDFIRGYEIYVIEGPQYVLNNNSIKKLVFSTETDLRNLNISRKFGKIPLSIYLTAFFDQSYVANYPNYNLNTRFSDTYLFGYGLGVDIVSFYDLVMRFEYSFNKANESGLRFNISAAF